MWSADNLSKQFGPRPGPTKCRACSGSKLFDTLLVFLNFFLEKLILKKNQQTTKKHDCYASMANEKYNVPPNCTGISFFLTHNAGKFCMLFCFSLIFFFQNQFLSKLFFKKYQHSVKQFGSRSVPTFCWA